MEIFRWTAKIIRSFFFNFDFDQILFLGCSMSGISVF